MSPNILSLSNVDTLTTTFLFIYKVEKRYYQWLLRGSASSWILIHKSPLTLGIGSYVSLSNVSGTEGVTGRIGSVQAVETHWVEFVIETNPGQLSQTLFIFL